jgi:transcription elongation factor
MGILLSCCFPYEPYPVAYGPTVYTRDPYYDPYYSGAPRFYQPQVHVHTSADSGWSSGGGSGGWDSGGSYNASENVGAYSGSSGFAG